MLDQLKKLIANFSLRQRIFIAAAAVAVMGGLAYFSHWSTEQDYKPLFTNLSAEDASAVVTKLKESGLDYRLADNGTTIKIRSAKIDEQRIQLTSAGIPKTGRIGYEIFDKTQFGQSDFAEQVNFHRAIEGELERSIASLAEVEQSRVHISLPKKSIFAENREPAKASIMVKLRSGARLSKQSVQGIALLVASAVEGLKADAVSIVDYDGNLLNRPRAEGEDEATADAIESSTQYRQKIERDLIQKVNTTLEPLLGPERFRAGISVECDMTSGEQSEETFDPTKSVMASTTRSEEVSTPSTVGGIPGTASNLPKGTTRIGSAGQAISRKSENTGFQTSRLVRRMKIPQGTIRRVSVSVLVDHDIRWSGSGANLKREVVPPSPEKLQSIKDLVSGIVGFKADRGDQVIVQALPFESTLAWQAPKPAKPAEPLFTAPNWAPSWMKKIVEDPSKQSVVLGTIAILLVLAIAIPILLARMALKMLLKLKAAMEERARIRASMPKPVKGKKGKQQAAIKGPDGKPVAAIEGEVEGATGEEGGVPALAEGGEMVDVSASAKAENAALEAKMREQREALEREKKKLVEELKLPALQTKRGELLTAHVISEAKRDPAALAQVVRTWLNDRER